MPATPSLDWDTLDRAVAIMGQGGLSDVRAQGIGPHTAAIDFAYPARGPHMSTERVFDSTAEVNAANMVVTYTLRFPGVTDHPDAPAPDAIQVALTAAAEELPAGYHVEIVQRDRGPGLTTYAPHVRADYKPGVEVVQFARQAVQAGEAYYDRLLG